MWRNYSISILIILLAGFLVIDPFLNKGIFKAHDMPSNLTYLGAFYSSLIEGNIVPRWGGNIANLYGSPTPMFFYPLSYYLASFIKIFGFSLINSIKIFIFITFILSSLVMYKWLRNYFSLHSALLGALIYVYAPYRISNIYARGSIAENTAFIFIPLILILLDRLWRKVNLKNAILLSFGTSGLILTHPFMVVISAPFYIFYVLFLSFDFKKIKYLILSIFLAFLLTAFYTLPLVIETKYTHYDMSPFKGEGYASEFLSLKKLILPEWNFIDIYGTLEYQTYQLGIIQILIFILSLISIPLLLKNKSVNKIVKKIFLLAVFIFLLSVFLTQPASNFLYQLLPLLKRIEFPWRFLSLTIFTTAILASLVISMFSVLWQKIIFVILISLSIILYLPYSRGHDYYIEEDSHYLYEITINTDAFATLPKWAAQPDKYRRITDRYEIIDGQIQVTPLIRTSTKHIYSLEAKTPAKMADSTFYFPGWKVFLNGKPIPIEFQNPQFRGIITFDVSSGKHLLEVIFTQTKVRKLADTISAVSIIFIIFAYLYAEKIQKYLHRYTGI